MRLLAAGAASCKLVTFSSLMGRPVSRVSFDLMGYVVASPEKGGPSRVLCCIRPVCTLASPRHAITVVERQGVQQLWSLMNTSYRWLQELAEPGLPARTVFWDCRHRGTLLGLERQAGGVAEATAGSSASSPMAVQVVSSSSIRARPAMIFDSAPEPALTRPLSTPSATLPSLLS